MKKLLEQSRKLLEQSGKLLMKSVLGLSVMFACLAATPTVANADYFYPGYHWEYRTVWVLVAYTVYDPDYGYYTVYKYLPIRKLVKVYDY